MTKHRAIVVKLVNYWLNRLSTECPQYNRKTHESIVYWLLRRDLKRYETLTSTQMAIAMQAMDFRYRILRHRYLGVAPERAYRNLMTRLGSLLTLCNGVEIWIAKSRDRKRTAIDVLQEVILELLQSDRYLQEQIALIKECTEDPKLRNSLLLASTEEYCLKPIRNQPLLLHRLVNYLRRSERGGITYVPTGDNVRLVAAEIIFSDE